MTLKPYERTLSNGVRVHIGPDGCIGWSDDWATVVRIAYDKANHEITPRFYHDGMNTTDYILKETA